MNNTSSAASSGYFHSGLSTVTTVNKENSVVDLDNETKYPVPSHNSQSTTAFKPRPTRAGTLIPEIKLRIHPVRSIILGLWIIFIAVLLWLLETAVKDGKSNPHPPWHLKTMPGLFLTFFAQAHAVVTATHLARVAASAIQSPRTAPRTWIEMFWMTDRAWAGPLGIAGSIWGMIRLRIRVSLTFALFSLSCLIAIATPSLLSRAYPVENVLVNVPMTIKPNTFAPSTAAFDAYLQESGIGSWSSGLAAIKLYNSTVFLPANSDIRHNSSSNIDPSDMFIAGDIGNANVTVPGLRLQGGCTIDKSQSFTPPAVDTTAPAFCLTLPNQKDSGIMESRSSSSYGLAVQTWMCSGAGFSSLKNTTQDEGYVYYTYTDNTEGVSGQGLVHCQVSLSTGYVHLLGQTRTFVADSFEEVGLFKQDLSQGGEAPSQPMAAAWRALGSTQLQKESIISGLGFRAAVSEEGNFRYNDVPEDMIASRMWSAITHLTTNMAILAWSEEESYSATVPIAAAVHVRTYPFTAAAYALLASWFVLMVSIPIYAWKRSFADHLHSYVASLVVLHHGSELMKDMPLGDCDENSRLTQRFLASDIERQISESQFMDLEK